MTFFNVKDILNKIIMRFDIRIFDLNLLMNYFRN